MIALAGRVTPNLPVAALRARGPLLEIGAYELALSRREAEILLRAAHVELEDVEINELLERTEGWADRSLPRGPGVARPELRRERRAAACPHGRR